MTIADIKFIKQVSAVLLAQVLPGLLLTLARRIDLSISKQGSLADGNASTPCYWLAATIAYVVGLTITLAANIFGWTFNGAQGQPALMYLVPCTVGTVTVVSICRREFEQVWHGSMLLFADDSSTSHPSDADAQAFSCCCNEYYDYDTHPNEPELKQL